MEVTHAMPMPAPSSNPSSAVVLSIALIDPDDQHRREVAGALAEFQGTTVREYSSFPADLDDLPQMLEQRYDAVIIGLDSDSEYAFDVVETLCAGNSTTVMVYSAQTQLELAVRFMRAGAREFLILPLLRADIAGALARVSIRRSASAHGRRTSRKLFVFLGVKGGCGVTTIASNFSVALAQESGQRTLLIDFGLPLGDVALNLGMVTQYSTTNALQDCNRLDGNFFRSLLAKHSSGLSVLAAPAEFSPVNAPHDAIDKLLAVARQSFDYVVVDAGSRMDLKGTALFEDSASLYLITQVGVTELRNANRLITQFFSARGRKLPVCSIVIRPTLCSSMKSRSPWPCLVAPVDVLLDGVVLGQAGEEGLGEPAFHAAGHLKPGVGALRARSSRPASQRRRRWRERRGWDWPRTR